MTKGWETYGWRRWDVEFGRVVDGNAKWLFMKEISISEFRTHCSRLIWEVSKTKQPIRITRRGKAVAEVLPPSPTRSNDWIGSMKDSMTIIGDIVSPASEEDE
jgi:prevent-host-death family protein